MLLYRSLAELGRLRDDWDGLAERLQLPTLEFDWFECSVTAFHDESDLRVGVFTEAGRLRAVAPLVVDRSRGTRLVLPGASALSEPGGWVYASTDALRGLASEVVSMREPVVLERALQPRDLVAAFPRALFSSSVTIMRAAPPSLALDVEGTWDAYVATLPTRTFRKMASIGRRAEREVGPVRVTTSAPRPSEVDDCLNLLAALEGAGWKGRRGSALGSRPNLRRFFCNYARRAAERRRIRVAVMSLGSKPAAIEIAVEAHGRHWVLKIAYDERLSTYGPGLLLTHASIQQAFENGLRSYEFLGVAEPWQERWRPSLREYGMIALYPKNSRGVRCAFADAHSVLSRRFTRARAAVATVGEDRLPV